MKLSRLPILAAISIAAVAVLAAGCGGDDDIPTNAVAVVDGTVITKVDLDALLGRAKTSYKSQKRTFPKAGTSEYQSLQTQAVAYLVQREEYVKEAVKLDVTITDAQVDKRIAAVAKQYFGGDQAQLKAQLKQQGYTDAAFREDIKSQLLSEGIFAKVSKGAAVTDAAVRKYYDDNKSQYSVAESRDVRHILVKTKAEADDVEARLKAGEDFGALAKELSQDPGSKNVGGKLTVHRGETVAEFDKAAFELKLHEVSEPIKTQFGYHVIEPLSEATPAATTPFEQVAKQIKAQLSEQDKQSAIEAWSKKLTADYKDKITYSAGYEPPATSSTGATSDGTG